MCGFNGYLWTDSGWEKLAFPADRCADIWYRCRRFLSALSMLSTVSIATANILILLRVMLLWKGNLQMKMFLYSVCGASICAFFSMMLLTVIKISRKSATLQKPSLFHLFLYISAGIQWNPYVKMCITTTKTPSMIATWAAPVSWKSRNPFIHGIDVFTADFWPCSFGSCRMEHDIFSTLRSNPIYSSPSDGWNNIFLGCCNPADLQYDICDDSETFTLFDDSLVRPTYPYLHHRSILTTS